MINEQLTPKNEKTTMWTNQTFPKRDPVCNLPSLENEQPYVDRVYDGPPGEWMPDLVPSETYIHHTLQRSLQLTSPFTPIKDPQFNPVPQILSPAQKIFGSMHDNTSLRSISEENRTLPRNVIGTMTPVSRRLYQSGSATMSRSGSITGHYSNQQQQQQSRFNTSGDEMESAYYTYSTTARFKPNNSTFR